MLAELETARSWFLEDLRYSVDRVLVVRLAEGRKLPVREPIDVGVGDPLGPYFPIQVTDGSRCYDLRFSEVLAFHSFDESYDGRDLALETEHTDRRTLSRVKNSALRHFVKQTTLVFDLVDKPVQEHFLWTEDCVLQVFSSGDVTLVPVAEGPNRQIKHTTTFSAR